MIEEIVPDHPEVALSTLCRLFCVSRSWYYQKPRARSRRPEGMSSSETP
jgi:hypothetical protein